MITISSYLDTLKTNAFVALQGAADYAIITGIASVIGPVASDIFWTGGTSVAFIMEAIGMSIPVSLMVFCDTAASIFLYAAAVHTVLFSAVLAVEMFEYYYSLDQKEASQDDIIAILKQQDKHSHTVAEDEFQTIELNDTQGLVGESESLHLNPAL
ncbi:MAG: hypothetical protein SFT93_01860 [Rickettsiaceae bacterium]|nr:hypothetical protein [Rickettsiaceae bacterium]